ncbi:hypothetical protein CG471_02215 [Sphingobium sp. IP1]|uniref:hypothetical protein n=1 Tax=Sphingobium sp. IP1 TaxID=2021637 RepID=UPI000C087546|nr:hypothetical protein [Sphingobium sp. IP1]PHP21406.1 hypothetical protein CG471_02215 [Sphingobium sp. IP1]
MATVTVWTRAGCMTIEIDDGGHPIDLNGRRPSHFERARSELMGGRWTDDEAEKLIDLVRLGQAQGSPRRDS